MWLWHRLTREQRRDSELLVSEKMQLMQEIRKAHIDWITAQQRLDFVLEKEQIDYAIFALEASQKRLDMLIKQAKNMKLSAVDVCKSRRLQS
jgi:16S rRNA C967 or C1407 C5-methylase (RsmB/RsmF family)